MADFALLESPKIAIDTFEALKLDFDDFLSQLEDQKIFRASESAKMAVFGPQKSLNLISRKI